MMMPIRGPLRQPTGKLVVLVSGSLLMTFLMAAVMPASAAIADHFSGSGRAALYAELILVTPSAAMIIAAPLAGILIQRWGRRRPLLAAIAIYTLAGGAGLIVEDFWTLALSRVVIGLAAGAISTISFTLTGDYFQGPARTRALAWVGAAPSAGSVVSLLAGGVLVDYGGWHAVFALYLAAIPVMILAAWVIQEPVQPSLHEPGGGALPPRFYLLYMLAVSVALAGVLPGIQLPFLLVGEGLRSATVTALLITCTALSSTVAAAAYPTLRRYLSIGEVLALMLAAAAVTYFLLAFEAGLPMIVLALVICGVPSGLTIPHMAAIAMERTTNLSRSRAIGLIVGGVFLGYFLIPFVSEPIRSALGSHGMFGALGAILVGAAIAARIGSRFVRSDGGRPVSSLKVSPPK